MPAGDRVQIGKAFKVEYGSYVFAGYQPTAITNQRTANVETIMDPRNAAISHQITNPGKQLTLNAMIEDSAGSITPITVGEIVTITPPEGTSQKWCVLASAPVSHSNGITTISITATREDSMAAAYDA
jgi:FtsP/CotA-like multicopper oxidase with cupredoxin domain